jgi:hypothetical protein
MSTYEEAVWLGPTGRGASLGLQCFKHRELKFLVDYGTAKYVIF